MAHPTSYTQNKLYHQTGVNSKHGNCENRGMHSGPLAVGYSWQGLNGSSLKGPVQSVSSVAQSCPTLCHRSWTAACQASLSVTSSQSLLKLMTTESVMPSNHLILCHPLLMDLAVKIGLVLSGKFLKIL